MDVRSTRSPHTENVGSEKGLTTGVAMSVSIADGLSRALKPRRIVTHLNAAAVAMHATVIDRSAFLMRSSFPRACAHLKWNVHFTDWLVDFARM